VVGLLSSASPGGYQNLLIAFRKGLAELGFSEGRNIIVEYRWAEGRFDRLPALAADLVQRDAAVIVTTGIGSALAAKAASATTSLVFLAGDDPVKFGLVASLSRPGGTATGVAWLTSELFTKRLGLVRELVPATALIGVLINPQSPEAPPQLKEIETAAQVIGQPLHVADASSETDFDGVFAALGERRADALIVSNDPFFNSARERIVALAARHRIPAIYDRREYTIAGGLISYGTSYSAAYRELGVYTGKILKGTKAADLPVEQATKFELVINLKTAKALGLEVSPSLLARADEVMNQAAAVHNDAGRRGCGSGIWGARVAALCRWSGFSTSHRPTAIERVRIPRGAKRGELRRGRQRSDRLPLGRESTLSASGAS
jgi:putative ABC transport system substrate-binding protein